MWTKTSDSGEEGTRASTASSKACSRVFLRALPAPHREAVRISSLAPVRARAVRRWSDRDRAYGLWIRPESASLGRQRSRLRPARRVAAVWRDPLLERPSATGPPRRPLGGWGRPSWARRSANPLLLKHLLDLGRRHDLVTRDREPVRDHVVFDQADALEDDPLVHRRVAGELLRLRIEDVEDRFVA